MKVFSPNEAFSGMRGRDVFVDGVCEQASPEQVGYYRRRGYRIIEELEPPIDVARGSEDDSALDRSAWKKEEWEAHAAALGLDVAGKTVADIKAAIFEFEAAE